MSFLRSMAQSKCQSSERLRWHAIPIPMPTSHAYGTTQPLGWQIQIHDEGDWLVDLAPVLEKLPVAEKVRALVAVRPDHLVSAANRPHPNFVPGRNPTRQTISTLYSTPLLDWIPDEPIRSAVLADNPTHLYDFRAIFSDQPPRSIFYLDRQIPAGFPL